MHSIVSSLDPQTILLLEWSIGSILVGLSGLLVLNYSHLVPSYTHRIVKYGKSAESGEPDQAEQRRLKAFFKFLELPKRYFFHFYSVALLFYIFLFTLAINLYFNLNLFAPNDGERQHASNTNLSKQISYSAASPIYLVYLRSILDHFAGYDYFTKYRYVVNFDYSRSYQRAASVAPESVILGLSMLITQVSRRLYECLGVSVYSAARMNIIHYMFGHLFYIGVGLSMLAEAPGFTGEDMTFEPNNYDFLKPNYIIGVGLFLWASYIQLDSHRILANLRKDTTGRVYTTKHMIPRGKWFDLVSSPHYMAEILIYLAITIVLGGKSLTWSMVLLFVVTNQIFVGKFNHYWYLETFKDYPKSRRAIIPYVL